MSKSQPVDGSIRISDRLLQATSCVIRRGIGAEECRSIKSVQNLPFQTNPTLYASPSEAQSPMSYLHQPAEKSNATCRVHQLELLL
jgi:hypothetical protein